MSLLEQIIERGNRSPVARGENWIICADGFKVSVIAGAGAYCTPRPALSADIWFSNLHEVPHDYPGPFSTVEVGYPSVRPEPYMCTAWHDGYDRHEDHPVCDGWVTYSDGDEFKPGSIYGYVPVEMVRALIASHGGEQA